MRKSLLVVILLSLLIWPISTAFTSIHPAPEFEYQGDGEIFFYNTHTDEEMTIKYKDGKGRYLEEGLDDIDYILRCRLTNEAIKMDLKLIELIDNIQDRFGNREIEIISGYRSPQLNNRLRASGRGVAKRSYHMKGMAVDIRIPGISSREIRNYARSLKAGGVGYYRGPDFVHVDVGPVRYW